MPDEGQDTRELRLEQAEREREERRLAETSSLDEETAQHRRRADKSAYLREKLAERERAEEEAER